MQRILTFLILIFILCQTVLYAADSGSALKVGDPAPAFYLKDIQNNDIFLSNYCGPKLRQPWKNKQKYVVVLSFWATWCGPCQREIPVLEDVLRNYEGKAVKSFLIDVGEKRQKVAPFVQKKGFQLPVLLDVYSMVSSKKYGVSSLPRLFVIDQQGTIRLINKGFTDAGHLRRTLGQTLDSLLK